MVVSDVINVGWVKSVVGCEKCVVVVVVVGVAAEAEVCAAVGDVVVG
jgi:hypothetical protein